MLDKLLKHLIREMGTSGSSGLDLSTLLMHAAQFHAEHDHVDPSSSTRPSQKIDDQYLRFLWKVLIQQDGVVVGRVIKHNKQRQQQQQQQQQTPQPVDSQLGSPAIDPVGGQPTTPSVKGKERDTSTAPPTPALGPDDDPEAQDSPVEDLVAVDANGLPPRKKSRGAARGAPAGMKGKQVAPVRPNGDIFELLDPKEYRGVRLDDLKAKYDDLRIAVDSDKMFFVLTGSLPGHVKMSEIIYQALSLIAATKEAGLDAIALGRHLGQDQRMVFYYVKNLLDLGLIFKFNVTAHSSMTFNLVHCHYVDKNDEHLAYATMGVEKPDYEDPYHPFVDFPASMQQNTRAVEKRVLDGLSVRSRGLVPSDQLVTELGYPGAPRLRFRKVVQRAVRKLIATGLVRRVRVININSAGGSRRYRALQLVHASTSTAEKKTVEGEDDEEVVPDDEGDPEEDEADDAVETVEMAQQLDREEMDEDDRDLVDEGEMMAVPDDEAAPSTARFEPGALISSSIPIERQIVQLIQDAGTNGMSFTELADTTKISRRYLDFFVEHHCAGPTAPPSLSHLNLVSISDFLGKERNLVVYTIENWLENCKKMKVDTDPKRHPPPDRRARGFLDLASFELWTTEDRRGQWDDSFTVPSLPGIAPYASARGGLKEGNGPGGRQGKVKMRHRRQGPPVPRTGSTGSAPAKAATPVDSSTNRIINPFVLHNKTLPSHTTLPTDDDGELILTPILPQRGPGQATINLLRDILAGRVVAPISGTIWDRLAKAGSHYGIRVPGLAPDDYGDGLDLAKLGATTKKLTAAHGPKLKPNSKPRPSRAGKRKRDAHSDASGVDEIDEIDEPQPPQPKKPRGRKTKSSARARASSEPVDEERTPQPPPAEDGRGQLDQSLASQASAQTEAEVEASPTAVAIERSQEVEAERAPTVQAREQPVAVVLESPARAQSEEPSSREPSVRATIEHVSPAVEHGDVNPVPADPRLASPEQAQPMEEAASSLLQLSDPQPGKQQPDAQQADMSPIPSTPVPQLDRTPSATPSKATPRPSRSRGIRENLVFANQKRDQQILNWIKDAGGIIELSMHSPTVLQEYLDQQSAGRIKSTRMDKRTLEQALNRLEDKSLIKVKIVAVQGQPGVMINRKVGFLPSLDKTAVDDFILDLNDVARPRRGPVPRTAADRELETVEMDFGAQDLTLTETRKLRARQLDRTLTVEDALAADGDENIRQLFLFDWRAASQQYGYISGTCARTALFHRELVRMIEADSSDSASQAIVSYDQRVFSTVDTIGELSLVTYLKLITMVSADDHLDQLLSSEAGRQTKMRDILRSLRVMLSVDRAVTIEKFQKMVQSFYFFKLAVPYVLAQPDKPYDLEVDVDGQPDPVRFTKDLSVDFTHFRLLARSAPLYAIGNGEARPPLVDVAPIETYEDVDDFWTRMEDFALNESEAPLGPFSPSFSVFPPTCQYPILNIVARPTSWVSTYTLGPVQRGYLSHSVDEGLTPTSPSQDEINRLAYVLAAPTSAVEQYVAHYIRKQQRTKASAHQKVTERQRAAKARTEKSTRELVAAKRAERRIQLEEDWSALARKYLATNRVVIDEDLATNLRGLRDEELADTTRSHLDAMHIAEVVQEMLDTEPELRPKPRPPPPPPVPATPVRAPARMSTDARIRARPSQGRDGVALVDEAAASDVEMDMDDEQKAHRPRVQIPCKLVTADDDYLIPDCVKKLPPMGPVEPGRRRQRMQYTEEFDNLILDLGAILVARSTRPGCRLSWKPAETIFIAVPQNTIRVRFMKLRDDPLKAAYIARLQDAYIDLWKAHRKTDALPDPPKYQYDLFDVEHHLKFFRKNVDKDKIRASSFGTKVADAQEEAIIKAVIVPSLPSTVEEVERTWSFQHPKTNSHLAGEEDDWRWLHERRMVTSEEMNELRMAGIQLYVDHNVPEPQVPQPPQEWLLSSVDISLAAATVKMTLNVPEALYDTTRANKILDSKRNKEQIISVTRAMWSASVVTKKAVQIKSRPHHLNLVNTVIDGPLSKKFFTETAKVEDQGGEAAILLEEEMSTWPFTATEGATAALLSLCSENRADLNVNPDDVAALAVRGLVNTKKLEDVDLELHVHGRITAPPPEMDDVEAPAPGPLEIIPAEVRREDRDEALAEVQGSDSIGVSENALALQKALQAAGKDGLKWNQLLTLPDVTAPLDCTTIIALARAFSTSSPPLAFWAGYDEARLVSSAFIRGWTCVIPPIEMSRGARARAVRDAREASEQEKMDEDENPDPSRAGSREAGSVPAEEKEAPHEKEQVGEQMLLYPKKWLSLEGEVIEPEWERSVRCVIGWIMARPTSELTLRHYLSTTFDRPELTDLLRFLLQEGIVRRTLVVDPAEADVRGLFKEEDRADFGEVGWLSREQEKRCLWQVVQGRWLEGFE